MSNVTFPFIGLSKSIQNLRITASVKKSWVNSDCFRALLPPLYQLHSCDPCTNAQVFPRIFTCIRDAKQASAKLINVCASQSTAISVDIQCTFTSRICCCPSAVSLAGTVSISNQLESCVAGIGGHCPQSCGRVGDNSICYT